MIEIKINNTVKEQIEEIFKTVSYQQQTDFKKVGQGTNDNSHSLIDSLLTAHLAGNEEREDSLAQTIEGRSKKISVGCDMDIDKGTK